MLLALIPLMAGLGFLALAVAPLLDTRLYFFDLLSHFPVQGAIGAAGVLVLSLPWRKSKAVRWGQAALFCALLGNLAWLYPYWGRQADTVDRLIPDLRIAQLNVRTSNRDFRAAVDWLRRVRPDVFVAEEVDAGWLDAFSALSGMFPYRVTHPRNDNFGLAVFSRFPVTGQREISLPHRTIPAFFLRLNVAGRTLRLAAIHTVPPQSQGLVTARNLSLDAVGQWAAEEPGTPTVVVGDLNTSPFAAPFRALLDYSGLRDGRAGRGVLATWPTYVPAWARIPLDYILHDRHLRTLTVKTGGPNGSDHLPVIGEFIFVK